MELCNTEILIYMDIDTKTHMEIETNTYMDIDTKTHMEIETDTYMKTHMEIETDTYMEIDTKTHMETDTYMYIDTKTHMETDTYMDIDTKTHMETDTYMDMDIDTFTIIISSACSGEILEKIINECFKLIKKYFGNRLYESDIKILYYLSIIYSYYDQSIGKTY